jgi:NAD(P)-dependent dehydrogenase (short-subunit alcohol dehydrogenase family)
MTIAIITGGSSGIGRSAAIQVAKRGTGVILTYNKNHSGAEETVAEIVRGGGQAVALALNTGKVRDFPAFKGAVVAALADTWGATAFDFLVNNAGFGQMSMFEDTSEEVFDRITDVILKGPYFLTQALLPLLNDGGSVVNVTSNASLPSGLEAGYSAYGTMKGGLTVLTRYMAKEFSTRGIRVNSVAPGPTRTRIGDDAFAKYPDLIAPIAEQTALGRLGEPDDIGLAIATLLSDDSRWITAQNIEVSGGLKL